MGPLPVYNFQNAPLNSNKIQQLPSSLAIRKRQSRKPLRIEAVNTEQIKSLRKDLLKWIPEKTNAPIIVRLAWHDSGTYDKNNTKGWPNHGGADGSIRLKPEIQHGGNAGLAGIANALEEYKQKYPAVTYADLYQLAAACAIESAGGPHIPLRFGRQDVTSGNQCPEEGRLVGTGRPPFDTAPTANQHLRNVFTRMGLSDKDTTALSGAHTLGRAHKNRSGVTDRESTKYTEHVKPGSTPGGQSWTKDWLVFDNSYFQDVEVQNDKDLLVLETDDALFKDSGYRTYAELYAKDQGAFFKDYAEAQVRLSELGSKWENDKPVEIAF